MSDEMLNKKLDRIIRSLKAILTLLAVAAGVMLFVLSPKLERVAGSVEDLTAELRPVLRTSSKKAVEAIENMDTEELSEAASKKAPDALDATLDRLIRNMESDKKDRNAAD